MDEQIKWVNFDLLENFMVDTFKKMGLNEKAGQISSDILISANKVGIDSHGIDRLKTYYYDRLKDGTIAREINIEIINDRDTTAVVDGHGGIGMVIGKESMQLAIEKAKKFGLGMVAVRNSNHYGFAGYYAKMAIDNEMIGITGTNTPPYVAPTFGVENLLGTNPLTFGIPTDEEFPFILDCASSYLFLSSFTTFLKLSTASIYFFSFIKLIPCSKLSFELFKSSISLISFCTSSLCFFPYESAILKLFIASLYFSSSALACP